MRRYSCQNCLIRRSISSLCNLFGGILIICLSTNEFEMSMLSILGDNTVGLLGKYQDPNYGESMFLQASTNLLIHKRR